jgi:hypothetical protein
MPSGYQIDTRGGLSAGLPLDGYSIAVSQLQIR